MRVRRLLALSMLLACMIGGLAGVCRSPPCPVELKVLAMERSGVLDEAGTEAWCATLSISNRRAVSLYFAREWATVEARVASRWTEAQNRCQVDHLEPREKREVVLFLPSGADACRLRLKYLPEPLNLRFMRVCGQLGLWRHPWGRALAARVLPVGWLEPLRSDVIGNSPHWRATQPELLLPRASPAIINASGGARHDGTPLSPVIATEGFR